MIAFIPVKNPPTWKKQVVASIVEWGMIRFWSEPRTLRMEKWECKTPFGNPVMWYKQKMKNDMPCLLLSIIILFYMSSKTMLQNCRNKYIILLTDDVINARKSKKM